MLDALLSWLEAVDLPAWVFALLFFAFVSFTVGRKALRSLRPKLELDIDDDAGETTVDFHKRRVYQTVFYRLNYSEGIKATCLSRLELEIELPRASNFTPRSIRVERVGYLHPGNDPLAGKELIEFSELGRLVVDNQYIRQAIARDAAKRALLLPDRIEYFIPFTRTKIFSFTIQRPKGVKTVSMELSYPFEEMSEDPFELVQVEPDYSENGVLRFIIRKDESIRKVIGYELRHPLPQDFRSFTLPVEYSPLEADLPTKPEDISVAARCPIDRFDPQKPPESCELIWIFNISQNVIDIRIRYHAAGI